MIVRGRWVVTGWGPDDAVLADGALQIREGRVAALGPYADVRARHPDSPVLGDGTHVVMPGFVNAHAHGRSSVGALLKGVPDEPLELRVVQNYLGYSDGNPYWDVFLSAIEQLEGGITTTVHLDVYYSGPGERYEARVRDAIRAYRDSGIRFAVALGIRDQNNYAYERDEDFLARVPAAIRTELGRWPKPGLGIDEYLAIYDRLREGFPERSLQFGPTNPVWCSEELLGRLREAATQRGALIHIHLLETAYQKAYALERYGQSMVRWLTRSGFLDRTVTCGHSVWLTEDDIRVLAEVGASVAHNPSANLRMRSGVSPARALTEAGVTVALGTDGMALNDDEDMLQEVRLAQLLHSPPGIDTPSLAPEVVLRWATEHGARAAGLTGLGRLAPGGLADLVLLRPNWPDDGDVDRMGLAARVVQRARRVAIDLVMVGGEVVVRGGQYVKSDRAEALRQVAEAQGAGSHAAASPVWACKQHVASMYARDPWRVRGEPYYVVNARR